jgi:hypothetical protein
MKSLLLRRSFSILNAGNGEYEALILDLLGID